MPDLSEDLVMKARAWVDNFWSRLQPMQKYTETFEMFDHFDQGDEHAIECGFGTAGTVIIDFIGMVAKLPGRLCCFFPAG